MISGKRERTKTRAAAALLAAVLLAAPAWAANPEVVELVRSLARPAPDTVSFVEVRFSPLLETPMTVSGTLGFLAPGRLSRTITEPYGEETTIDGDKVLVRREGEKDRRFSLRRAPELRGLLGSFSAILSGNPEALEEFFDLSMSRAGPTDPRWTLALVPHQEKLRARIGTIRVTGAERAVHCITMGASAEAASVILLGLTATELPDPLTAGGLERQCAGAP